MTPPKRLPQPNYVRKLQALYRRGAMTGVAFSRASGAIVPLILS
jgi:hypothetical protein